MTWLTGWGFRKEITIDDTNVDGNLTDFPAYVLIDADADFHEAKADGYDIRFTQSDGETLLKYEREYWTGGDGSAATAHYWVKVPSILATGGATIYCYYGKADAPDGEDAANVWDANFKGVWHMTDALTTTIADSSGNGRTGTKSADGHPTEIADGKIYKAQNWDGDEYIDEDNGIVASYPYTLSAWSKTTDTNNHILVFVGDKDTQQRYSFIGEWWDGGVAFARAIEQWTTDDVLGTISLSDGTWHHVVGVFGSSTSRKIYTDGGDMVEGTTDIDDTAFFDRWAIGAERSTDTRTFWDGDIDEVRITNDARTAEEIKFEHANINEGDNELTWGGEESEEAPSVYIPKVIFIN